MKSIDELINLLNEDISEIDFSNTEISISNYYEYFGDITAIVAAIMDKKLEEVRHLEPSKWNLKENWIDDGIIDRFEYKDDILRLWGVLIWGVNSSTEQWTDPFYFEYSNTGNNKILAMLFKDSNQESLKYSDYILDSGIWNNGFYSSKDWNVKERNWVFKF